MKTKNTKKVVKKSPSKKRPKLGIFHNKVFLSFSLLSIVVLSGIIFLVQQKQTLTQNAAMLKQATR
jgi:hypothetical protein